MSPLLSLLSKNSESVPHATTLKAIPDAMSCIINISCVPHAVTSSPTLTSAYLNADDDSGQTMLMDKPSAVTNSALTDMEHFLL
jgi:hypothetical protein